MLKAIRESILPYVKPSRSRRISLEPARSLSQRRPACPLSLSLRNILGAREAERRAHSTQLKEEGVLERQGSPRSGVWVVRPGTLRRDQ